jgi:uncharacterized protein (TIGR00251 family)
VNGWCRRTPAGWLLSIHAQPGAKRTAVAGLHGDALKVRVAAPPIEGRANDELVALIAEVLGVPRKCVTVVKGATSRRKTVSVAVSQANPAVLLRQKAPG